MGLPIRSTHSRTVPQGRRVESHLTRPDLHVVSHAENQSHVVAGVRQLIHWTKTRSQPLVHVIIAVIFLVLCMLGSLILRTQMAQHSFEASQVEQNITVLQQDIEEDQAKLDALEASLPQKAQDMHMVPSEDTKTIDLQGYKPSQGGDSK